MAGNFTHISRRLALRYTSTCLKPPTFYVSNKRWIRTTVSTFGDPILVNMPVLSPTMESGTIVKWHKREGEVVNPGDILCEVQTDKAVISFETEEEGVMAKILKGENEQIPIGTLIALIAEEGDDWKSVQVPAADTSESPGHQPSDLPASSGHAMLSGTHARGVGPAVRSLLDIYRLQPTDIAHSGPGGRLLKGDILEHVKKNNLKPAPISQVQLPSQPAAQPPAQPSSPPPGPPPAALVPPSPPALAPPVKAGPPSRGSADFVEMEENVFDDLTLTSMRKVIAKRLTESKTTIPHAYASADCSMHKLLQLRKDMARDGVKVSVNDFIIKAAAVALHKVPEVNSVWTGESAQAQSAIDISVAVATDSGLITPIVKDAIGLGLQDISAAVRDLSSRAREGKLQLHEFQGGSFTISNLGMFGITEFSAVINPPQACILAVGGSRLTLDEHGDPQTLMTVTLSADRRVVDEFLVARFLDAFREAIEEPMSMLAPSPQRLFAV